MNIIIEEDVIIDWYDGMVRGLIRSGDEWKACLLIAFDPDRNTRLYSIFQPPLSPDRMEPFRTIQHSRWITCLGTLVREAESMWLTDHIPNTGGSASLRAATNAELEEVKAYGASGIDEAVLPERADRWL